MKITSKTHRSFSFHETILSFGEPGSLGKTHHGWPWIPRCRWYEKTQPSSNPDSFACARVTSQLVLWAIPTLGRALCGAQSFCCMQSDLHRYTVHPLKTQTPGTQEKTWFGLMFLHFHFGGYFRFQQLVLDVLGECNSNLPMHGTVSPFQIQILYIDGMFLARNALPTLRLKESLQLFGGFVDHSTLFWCWKQEPTWKIF